ncbi:type II secretion system F family protein [Cohnella luojiensis]|uniref:Type II secretion protein F n=1 Tax=Cohnella luojiensis TaxID=652876 RepID=A0A4Y8M2X4_9BACL|nr:type II secretion system F family protein [Cohnella luojiensis]TFE28203.1 type II secretion protein F [Cohnella luojiensis]
MSDWMPKMVSACLIAFYAGLVIKAWRVREENRFLIHIEPFVVMLRIRPVHERLHPLLHKQRLSLSLLNGGDSSLGLLIAWTAESIGLSYIALTITSLLALMSGNPGLLLMGFIIACCLPVLRTKELFGKVNRRRQEIVMELPELLSKLLLMVNAGENVMRALTRILEQKKGSKHPLYVELMAAIEMMKRGESLSLALEEMGRRCAVPEVKLFATTLLINARRGGDDFVPALRELTRQMWDKRKAIARTLGEQASSRLAFPLTLVFLLIMVLVGAPAMFMM